MVPVKGKPLARATPIDIALWNQAQDLALKRKAQDETIKNRELADKLKRDKARLARKRRLAEENRKREKEEQDRRKKKQNQRKIQSQAKELVQNRAVVNCPMCNGSGRGTEVCTNCNGTQKVYRWAHFDAPFNCSNLSVNCKHCGGTGVGIGLSPYVKKIPHDCGCEDGTQGCACKKCRGHGIVYEVDNDPIKNSALAKAIKKLLI